MSHEAHRRIPATQPAPQGTGCIPASVLAEESQARANNVPSTDALWSVVTRLSEAVGRQQAEINHLKEQRNA